MLININSRYQPRFYRNWIGTKDLYRKHICIKETDLDILSDIFLEETFLKEKILFYRNQIQDYISKDRRFLLWLEPLEVNKDAPLIVKDMAEATKKAGVGPMASVAGAIAQYLGKEIMDKGAEELIIENGGDIFLRSKKVRYVGIYAGSSKFSGKLFLKLEPKYKILGVCTSSATVSHSLSFGSADAVTILAEDALLADAVATAACNRVKSEEDFENTIEFVKNIKGVLGIVIILKDKLASWGEIEFA